MPDPKSVGKLFEARFDWAAWEARIRARGVVIDRPRGSRHPKWDDIVYPIDYGYLPGTDGGDGGGIDVFVGTAETGLVGLHLTHDRRKGDREVKLLLDVSRPELYLVHGFLNFAPELMTARLVLRERLQRRNP